MNRGTRALVAALAVSMLLAPAVTLHPAAKHASAAGLSNLVAELAHPGMVGFLLLGAFSVLPAIGFSLSLAAAANGRSHLTALSQLSEPAASHGFAYRRLVSPEILIFTAGTLRPVTFVSSGAEQALSPSALHAALLHEEAHRRRRDTFWRLLLRGVARGFGFSPWVRRLVETESLRSECSADDYALKAGAEPAALFDAIVAASTPREVHAAVGLAGGDTELRLVRLVEPGFRPPRHTTPGLLALNIAIVLPAVITHAPAFAADAHAPHVLM